MTINKPNTTQSSASGNNNATQTIIENLERMDIASPSSAQQSHNTQTGASQSSQLEKLPSPNSDHEFSAEYRRCWSKKIRQLREENDSLRKRLKKSGIPWDQERVRSTGIKPETTSSSAPSGPQQSNNVQNDRPRDVGAGQARQLPEGVSREVLIFREVKRAELARRAEVKRMKEWDAWEGAAARTLKKWAEEELAESKGQ
jgi:hypothetical protein